MNKARDYKQLLFLLLPAAIAVVFSLFYVGRDIFFFQDSMDYLWGAFEIVENGYFFAGYSGFHPPGYLYFLNLGKWVFGGTYLDSSILLNLVMLAILGGLSFIFVRQLGCSKLKSLLFALIFFSNPTLYTHALAGLNSEVIYFPALMLSLILLYRRENPSALFSFVFGLLVYIRNMHLFFALPLFLISKGWRRKIINMTLFLSGHIFNHFKTSYYGNEVRALKSELGLSINWGMDWVALKNTIGVNYSNNLAILTLLVFCATLAVLIWKQRQDERRSLTIVVALGISFVAIILLTNILYDSNVSFRERMLLHLYVVLFPICFYLVDKLTRHMNYQRYAIVIVAFSWMASNIISSESILLRVERFRHEQIKSLIPSYISNLKGHSFVASDLSSYLRDQYDIEGYSDFFRDVLISKGYPARKNVPELPERFHGVLFELNPYKPKINLAEFIAELDRCDIRSRYDFRELPGQGLEYHVEFFKVREISEDCN